MDGVDRQRREVRHHEQQQRRPLAGPEFDTAAKGGGEVGLRDARTPAQALQQRGVGLGGQFQLRRRGVRALVAARHLAVEHGARDRHRGERRGAGRHRDHDERETPARGRRVAPQLDPARPDHASASAGKGRMKGAAVCTHAAVAQRDGAREEAAQLAFVGHDDDRLSLAVPGRPSGPSPRSAVAESRLPVGSSATINAGSLASERAIATRCCWPPDSAAGSLSAWSATRRRSSNARARGRRSRRGKVAQEVHRQHHVLGDGERGQELEELEDDSDAAPAPRGERVLRQRVQRLAVDGDLAIGRLLDAGQQVRQRRLAAARRSDNGDALAGADVEIDVVERAERTGRGDMTTGRPAQADEAGKFEIGHGGALAMWREAEHTVQHLAASEQAVFRRSLSNRSPAIVRQLPATVTVEIPLDRRAAVRAACCSTRCAN